ncbi:MAG: c-type cytochrome [Myxococcaceae bacterium]
MSTLKSRAALVTAALTVAAPAWGVDWRAPRVVTVSCSACHGIDGNSESPTTPRLAAQSLEYLQEQMSAYRLARMPPVDWLPFLSTDEKPGARTGPLARTSMIGPSHYTGEDDSSAAVDWYAKQKPAPRTPGGPSDLVTRGAKIYADGLPDENVAACVGCHGPDAQGKGKYPRLAGQHAEYLSHQIELLSSGTRPSSLMGPTAHALSKPEIEALVVYLEQL